MSAQMSMMLLAQPHKHIVRFRIDRLLMIWSQIYMDGFAKGAIDQQSIRILRIWSAQLAEGKVQISPTTRSRHLPHAL